MWSLLHKQCSLAHIVNQISYAENKYSPNYYMYISLQTFNNSITARLLIKIKKIGGDTGMEIHNS